MSDSVAQDQIRAFVDRILRMKEEAKAINADIREIYAEAKGNGFDKTVLGKLVSYVEKRNAGAADLQEAEAIFDLYLSAYDAASHTHAPARTREDHSPDAGKMVPPHDADGEIIEPNSAPIPAGSMADGEGCHNDALPEPIQPETATSFSSVGTTTGIGSARDASAKKRWSFSDPAHPDCLDADRCGGLSNLGLCARCEQAAGHVVQLEATA